MFRKISTSDRLLEEEIASLLRRMRSEPAFSEDYAKMMENVIKLQKLKTERNSDSVSKDTLALIAANLAGIVLVLKHEKADIIASKAFGMLIRAR